MSKKGVSVISGSKSPVIGEKNIYNIVSWYPATSVLEQDPTKVTWELFKKRSSGKFTTTNNKKLGRSDFTFGESAAGHTYRLEAYRYRPEGGGLVITPQPAKIPKINKVELFYVDDTKGTTFSFMEKLRARANCTNMLGKTLLFTLWEDDATGVGHNSKNLFVDSRPGKVNADGVAAVDFTLTQALMKKAAKGEMDSQLEFYVTVEYYKNKKHATQNVNVKNPFPTKPEVKTPAPKPKDTAAPKAPGSPAETKPKSQKEEKGILDTISDKLDELWDWAESSGTATKDKEPTLQKPTGKAPTIIKGSDNAVTSTCMCKELYADLYWGGQVSCEFRKKVMQISAELWGESKKKEMADGLMAVMNVETGGSFKAHQIMGRDLKDVNKITKDDFWLTKADGTKTSRAVGLIQFTQSALQAIGEFKAGTGFDKLHAVKLKFATMGEIKQLDYVKKYFMDSRSKIKTPADIYLHVFAPSGVAKKDDYVLYVEGTEEYRQNKSVDLGSKGQYKEDGKIQRSEILERFDDSMKKGANNKPKKYVCASDAKSVPAVVEDLITIHIYTDGLMEKHTPPKIKAGFEKKYKYVYHDKSGTIHDLGIYTIIPTQVFGGKKGANINLVDLSTIKESFKSGPLQYTFKIDSPRKYVNTRTLASLFGAMLEVSYNDFSCNGFSHSDGSSRPSTSHVNGNNGDFKFLRKDKKLMVGQGTSLDIRANPDMFDDVRQNKWNDALFRFGWKSMLGWSYKRNGKVYYPNHIKKNSDNHHHHLHLQGYNPNFK